MAGVTSAVSYEVTGVKTRVYPEESLIYRINIINNDSVSKEVYINKYMVENTFGMASSVRPSINLVLSPNSSTIINVTIPVSNSVTKGTYSTPLLFSYGNTTTDRVYLESVILSKVLEPIELQNITVINPESIIPVHEFNTTVTLLCNIESVYPLVKITVSDDNGIIYESSSVQELKEGINVFRRSVKLPDRTMPGTYTLLVEASVSGRVITQGVGDLVINPYTYINYSAGVYEDLFGKRVNRTADNLGTEIINTSVNYTTSLLEPLLINRILLLIKKDGNIISSTTPVISDYLINELVTLESGESAELIIEFGYGLLIAIPFVIILVIIGWFFVTKRVIVKKEIIECHKDGNELTVKVGVSVKNVSLSSINNVKIIEDLPVYAKKAGAFGSIKGDIDRKKGIITFLPGRLDPKEEVLLSYKFKTDIELVGRVSLPPATVKFRVDDKVMIVKSNTTGIELIKGGE
jgi:hypothetical protein